MFKRLKLKTQIILIIGSLSAVLLILFGALAYSISSRIIFQQVAQNSATVLEQINAITEQWFSSMETFSLSVSMDKSLGAALQQLESKEGLSQIEPVNTAYERMSFYQASRPDVYQMTIYTDAMDLDSYFLQWGYRWLLSTESEQYRQIENDILSQATGIVPRHLTSYVAGLPSRLVVTYYRRLKTFPSDPDNGLLCIDIPAETLNKLLEGKGGSNDVYFILGESGQMITCDPAVDAVLKSFLEENNETLGTMGNLAGYAVLPFQGEKHIMTYSSLNRFGLRTIQLKPYDELFSSLPQLLLWMLGVGSLCFLFAIFLVILFSRRFLRPIFALIAEMNRVGSGDFQVKLGEDYTNEIGELNRRFLWMTQKLSSLLDHVSRVSQQKTAAELKALQEQINPHFLYNTLDCINWMAIRAHASEISTAIASLGEFFRLSLSSGSLTIPLGEELERLKIYLELQNLRWKGRILYEEEIDPELKKEPIIRLILQPFIENSIQHGLPPEGGEITVSGWKDGHDIFLQISDDGCGISEERISQILEKPDETKSGYGIYNVHQRIQLYYGARYGVKYLPVRRGATALIHISDGLEEEKCTRC